MASPKALTIKNHPDPRKYKPTKRVSMSSIVFSGKGMHSVPGFCWRNTSSLTPLST